MQDDGPQVILPVSPAPEQVAARLRRAEAIIAESGFTAARVEEEGETVLIQVAPADLTRLQDEAFREGLVARLKSLGYAFAAIDITAINHSPSPPKGGEGMGEGVLSD